MFNRYVFLKSTSCSKITCMLLFSSVSMIFSQHQSCGRGVKQAGRVCGQDTQSTEENTIGRNG